MEAIYAWARNLIVCLCLLELFCHLVRNADYRRYIRFFGGFLVLLLVFAPVGKLLAVDDSLEEALRQAFLWEDARELQISREALADLRSEKIAEAYRAELERQLARIVEAHAQQSSRMEVRLSQEKENLLALEKILIVLLPRNSGLNVFAPEQADEKEQQQAAREIEEEIKAVYGLEDGAVQVTVKR